MSNIIPPFISNTPPPLPTSTDESFDEEDEFGVFCGYGDQQLDQSGKLSFTTPKLSNDDVEENHKNIENLIGIKIAVEKLEEKELVNNNIPLHLPSLNGDIGSDSISATEETCQNDSAGLCRINTPELSNDECNGSHTSIHLDSCIDANPLPHTDVQDSLEVLDVPCNDNICESNPNQDIHSDGEFEKDFSSEVKLNYDQQISNMVAHSYPSDRDQILGLRTNDIHVMDDLTTSNDDDFGDFASFDKCDAQGNIANTVKSCDVFDANDSFCDFQSFSQFSSAASKEAIVDNFVPNYVNREGVEKHEEVFAWAADSSIASDDVVTCEDLTKSFRECVAGADTLWSKIWNSENSRALGFQWSNSDSYKLLLSSLQVDSRNILFNNCRGSQVPLFAMNMGSTLLEPQKIDASCYETGEYSVENSMDGNLDDDDNVPPAMFDWSSSGLTNPLDASNIALLDLDFFNTNDNVIPLALKDSSLTCLEKELMQSPDSSTNKIDALNDLLSSSGRSIILTNNTDSSNSLSKEAEMLLDRLPKLQFMKSPVLMFPIKSFTEDLQ